MASPAANDPEPLWSGGGDKHKKLLQMIAKAEDAKKALGKEAKDADSPRKETDAPGPEPEFRQAVRPGLVVRGGAHVEADATGPGVESGSDSEAPGPLTNEFQLKADAPEFVPGRPMPLVLCCFGPDDTLPPEAAVRPANQRRTKPITEFQMRVEQGRKTLEAYHMPIPRNQRRLVHTAEAAEIAAKRMLAEAAVLAAEAAQLRELAAEAAGRDTELHNLESSKPFVQTDAQMRSDLPIFFGAHPDFPRQAGNKKVPRITQVADEKMPQTIEGEIDEETSSHSDSASLASDELQHDEETEAEILRAAEKQAELAKVAQIVKGADAKKTRTAMASVFWTKSKDQSGLLSALNLSLPTKHRKLRQIYANASDCRNISQVHGKSADAAVFSPLSDPGAPPGLSHPEGITPQNDLTAPTGLVKADAVTTPPLPNFSMAPDLSLDSVATLQLLEPAVEPGVGLAEADAADLLPPPDLEAPPGLPQPDSITPPEDHVPSTGLAGADADSPPPPADPQLTMEPSIPDPITALQEVAPPGGSAIEDAVDVVIAPVEIAPPGGLAKADAVGPAVEIAAPAGLAKADAERLLERLPGLSAYFPPSLNPGAPPGLSPPDAVTPPEDCAPPAGLAAVDAVALPPAPGPEAPPGLSLGDGIATPEDLEPPPRLAKDDTVALPSAPAPQAPPKRRKEKKKAPQGSSEPPKALLATPAASKTASKKSETNAAAPSLLSEPKSSSSVNPPKGLAKPAGLAGPRKDKAVSISKDYMKSDAKITNDDTSSMNARGSSNCEEDEPEPEHEEDFQEKADASCFAAIPSATARKMQLPEFLGKGTGLLAFIFACFFFFTLLFGIMLPEDVAGKVLPAALVPVLEVLAPVLEVVVPVIVVGSMVWHGIWSGKDQKDEHSKKCA